MNALFVLSAIAASFNAVVYCGDYSTHGYSKHGGSVFGGGGGGSLGGHGGGPLGGEVPLGGLSGGSLGGGGPYLAGFPKSGTCPQSFDSDSLQMGPYCYDDEQCHGVQKCCPNVFYGNRCQIPVEYQRSGTCNTNYVYGFIPFTTRTACNHDHSCPFDGKCCRRQSSGQVDTCTAPIIRGPYPGAPGGPGTPGGPGGPGIPYPPVPGHGPVYPRRGKVY